MGKLYLAAAYSRRDEMVAIAERLIAAGHTITSRWIYGDHEVPPDGIAVDSSDHYAWAAQDDLDDIDAADCVLSVTDGGHRGGRHAEFGAALVLGKRLVILGDREHVFHFMPDVDQYGNLEAVIAALEGFGLARTR